MKRIVACLMFGLLGFFAWSCDDDKSAMYRQDFEKSYAIWLQFKAANANSYYYITESSSWVGFRSKTTIFVEEGSVVKRAFQYTYYENGKLVEKDSRSWIETGSELGKHKEGTELSTLDSIYKKAETEWLVKRDNVRNYFEAKNKGMLSLCGYVDNRCADDCFVGVSISEIRPLGTP